MVAAAAPTPQTRRSGGCYIIPDLPATTFGHEVITEDLGAVIEVIDFANRLAVPNEPVVGGLHTWTQHTIVKYRQNHDLRLFPKR